jgi:hypothetical protein
MNDEVKARGFKFIIHRSAFIVQLLSRREASVKKERQDD